MDSPHKRPLEQQAITCSCIDCACIQRHLSSAQNPSSASLLNFVKHPTQCCNTLLKRWITNYVVWNLFRKTKTNKGNLRDLIAATGLVILLKLDSNGLFFSRCDLEIWWMTPKNNRAPLLCYFKLFASFHSHWWIQSGVTVRKHLIWVKIDNFLSRVTLIFDGRPSKTIGHLFSATSSFVQHFVAIGEFKLELQSGKAQSGSKSKIFSAVWPSNLTDSLEKQ